MSVLSAGADETVLDRLHVQIIPEFRTTYFSLGKLVEDRPMQVTRFTIGYDLGDFGTVGFHNQDVSSLTDRRHDVHQHMLYHTQYSPYWEYTLAFSDEWKLRSCIDCGWTVYRGFVNDASNKTYQWWQLEQSLVNPFVTPYYRIRRYDKGVYYLYCRLGLRRKFPLWRGLYLTPEVAIEGGDHRLHNRNFGNQDDLIGGGFYTISPRLEFGWTFSANFTLYAWIEQYEVMGDARSANDDYSYRCTHNDWTYGGVGLRMSF